MSLSRLAAQVMLLENNDGMQLQRWGPVAGPWLYAVVDKNMLGKYASNSFNRVGCMAARHLSGCVLQSTAIAAVLQHPGAACFHVGSRSKPGHFRNCLLLTKDLEQAADFWRHLQQRVGQASALHEQPASESLKVTCA